MDRYLDSSWKVSIFIIHKTKDVRNGTNQDQQSRVGKHCYWKKNIFNQLFTVELELYCIVLQYFNIFQWNGFIFVWKFNWNLVSYATIIIIRFIGLKLKIKCIISIYSYPHHQYGFLGLLVMTKKKHLSSLNPIVWQAIQHNLWFILCSDHFFCQGFLPVDKA